MPSEPVLSVVQRACLASARRAVLATISPDGRPRLVPICFVLDEARPVLYTPIDDKPKRSDDPLALARVRDIVADARVTVLVDRWDEDWSRLGWLRCHGRAAVREPTADGAPDADAAADSREHASAVAALRHKYPQYAVHRLEARPLIRVTIERVAHWGALDGS
jgi:PPOX class probable F420-dependent enzyme